MVRPGALPRRWRARLALRRVQHRAADALPGLLLAFLAAVFAVLVGTFGHGAIGRGPWPLLDCLDMTVIGLTAAGVGEGLPLSATALGRPFTLFTCRASRSACGS